MPDAPSPDQLRDEWLDRISQLVRSVQGWAESLGWATRQIEVTKEDSRIGRYRAPALLMQHEATRVLLEPIARATRRA